MSIKSQTPGIASDMSGVLIKNQRSPNYGTKTVNKKNMVEDFNLISPYVKRNLKKVVRGQEYR